MAEFEIFGQNGEEIGTIEADFFVFAGYGGYEFMLEGNGYRKLVGVVPCGCVIANKENFN